MEVRTITYTLYTSQDGEMVYSTQLMEDGYFVTRVWHEADYEQCMTARTRVTPEATVRTENARIIEIFEDL